MAVLVQYASSDEESEQEEEVQTSPRTETREAQDAATAPQPAEAPTIAETEPEAAPEDEPEAVPVDKEAAATQNPELAPAPAPAPTQDVIIGPTRPAAAADMAALPSLDDDDAVNDQANGEPPLSPYSAERAAVRQLTMPRVPNFNIPSGDDADADADAASSSSSAALNKKFATFLELKQKKDTHFNARLAQSDAMKNPALMDKLMAFVGLPGAATATDADDDASKTTTNTVVDTDVAAAPYQTTLPTAIWDPAALPAEAYRRSLRRLQEEAAKQRARMPGQPVNFVAATLPAATATAASTPAGGKRKTRFD